MSRNKDRFERRIAKFSPAKQANFRLFHKLLEKGEVRLAFDLARIMILDTRTKNLHRKWLIMRRDLEMRAATLNDLIDLSQIPTTESEDAK